jgi:hypothetical protein
VKIAFVLLLALCTVAGSPAHSQSRAATSPDAALARPSYWGTNSPVLFANDADPKVNFRLQTSWIPGERHRGMFRYKLWVSPSTSAVDRVKNLQAYSPEAIAVRLKRISACNIYLQLYDKDDFALRQIMVPFDYYGDDNAQIIALTANTWVEMDAPDYRKFSAWTISWSCPKER